MTVTPTIGVSRSLPGGQERYQFLVRRKRRCAWNAATVPQKESVTYDFRLLFDPVSVESPSRLEVVVISAPWVTTKDEIPVSTRLGLPDMRHLVDEMRLPFQRRGGEVIAIPLCKWMEMQVSARSHRDIAGLERKPLATLDGHTGIVDTRAENARGQRNFARRQRPYATRRAGRMIRVRDYSPISMCEPSSPVARMCAGKLTLSPLSKVRVTSV